MFSFREIIKKKMVGIIIILAVIIMGKGTKTKQMIHKTH